MAVPNEQRYALGLIDNEAWEETEKEWEQGELAAPNSFRLDLTITRSSLPNSPSPPTIDDLIAESRVDVE